VPLPRSRHATRPRAVLLTAVLAAAVTAPTAPAQAVLPVAAPAAAAHAVHTAASATYTPAQLRMRRALTSRVAHPALGRNVSGYVVDAASGKVVWGWRSTAPLTPASNTKLVTAVTALRVLGPEKVLVTRVRQGQRTASTQVVHLVGAADPALSRAALDRMAASTLRNLGPLGGRTVTVAVDDSLFPAPRRATGWPSSYYPHQVAPVRALIVDQHEAMDTSLDAGRVFASRLTAHRARVARVVRSRAPAGSRVLSATTSPPMRTLVATMLSRSDNDYAEGLLRLSALARRLPATWQGSTYVARAVLVSLKVPMTGVRLYDGSGLSRSDRLTARSLAALMREVVSPRHPELASMMARGSLPSAGISGTLAPKSARYVSAPTRCARGLIRAKTGSLRDVVALSGVATGSDRRRYVFSFLVNGKPPTLTTRSAVDRLATTVTGCW